MINCNDLLQQTGLGCRDQIGVTLKYNYSITKRLAENVKTVLELWGIGLQNMYSVNKI